MAVSIHLARDWGERGSRLHYHCPQLLVLHVHVHAYLFSESGTLLMGRGLQKLGGRERKGEGEGGVE